MKPLKDREEKILQFMASEIKLKGRQIGRASCRERV